MMSTLEPYEVAVATIIGAERQCRSMQAGRMPRATDGKRDLWKETIWGTAAEVAVAKALGLYWPPALDTFTKIPDAGPYEVRYTFRDDGRLWIRDSDPDGRAFILVRGEIPTFTLIGWFYARDAKRDEWRIHQEGYDNRCYFVPTSELRPISDLPIQVAEYLAL